MPGGGSGGAAQDPGERAGKRVLLAEQAEPGPRGDTPKPRRLRRPTSPPSRLRLPPSPGLGAESSHCWDGFTLQQPDRMGTTPAGDTPDSQSRNLPPGGDDARGENGEGPTPIFASQLRSSHRARSRPRWAVTVGKLGGRILMERPEGRPRPEPADVRGPEKDQHPGAQGARRGQATVRPSCGPFMTRAAAHCENGMSPEATGAAVPSDGGEGRGTRDAVLD